MRTPIKHRKRQQAKDADTKLGPKGMQWAQGLNPALSWTLNTAGE